MLRLLNLLSISLASVFDCSDSSCSLFLSGYLYSYTCLLLCPTGFNQATAPSICTSSGSLNIFDINFLDFSVFTATTIDLYSHPNGLQFNDAARLSPIPTKYMGFYFTNTSKLISTTRLIPGPDLTLRFCIKILTNGTIFQIREGSYTIINIAAVSGLVISS